MTLEKLRYRKPCKECKVMMEFPTLKARNLTSYCYICRKLRKKKQTKVYCKAYNQKPKVKARIRKQRASRAGDPKWRKIWREYRRTWNYKNILKRRASDKRYRESHREHFNRLRREWYHKNKDKVKLYPSQQKEARHEYYLKNKAKLMRYQKEKRARKRNADKQNNT